MRRKLVLLVIVVFVMLAADRLTQTATRESRLPERPIDIQHPSVLISKLEYLRDFKGTKIVLLGDSLIYGGILEEFGDREWREHGLHRALDAELRQNRLDDRLLVMNLGINGALPADVELLMPLVLACGVDWIIFDIHLRPFSSDFVPENTRLARPWLRECSVDAAGRFHWRPNDTDSTRIGNFLAGRLPEWSTMFESRVLIQQNVGTVVPSRKPVNLLSADNQEIEAMVKVLQMKNRLATVDLSDANPQVTSLKNSLAELSRNRQKHIVFYARENPELLPDVIEAEQHQKLYSQLVETVRETQGTTGVWMPPVKELQPSHYLDFAHVNAEGYRILAKELAKRIP